MRVLFTISALLGGLAVVLGAFGAHRLKMSLTPDQLQTFETGVRYQFYHVLAAMFAAGLALRYPEGGFLTAGWLFIAGMLFFSGSVYLLACKDLLHLGSFTRILGPITPIGGLLFIIGWAWLAVGVWRSVR